MSNTENKNTSIDIHQIRRLLPHRYPFLLIDRVLDYEVHHSLRAIKNVTVNEPQFTGHFPETPIMPGVLLIEGMAQTAGALCVIKALSGDIPNLVYFMTIDNAKFRKPVLPGDTLRFELKLLKLRSKYCKMAGKAFVGDELVAEADLLSTVVDREAS